MKHLLFACLGFAVLPCLGCGGGADVAKVSGTIKLDDQPLANATVFFLPMAKDGEEAGPSSNATTDEKGKFTLRTSDGQDGAVIGKHRVMITTVVDNTGEGEGEEADNIYSADNMEKLPARYNSASTLEFDVPSEGTDAANFDLTSKR